jgi:hypothetical protein
MTDAKAPVEHEDEAAALSPAVLRVVEEARHLLDVLARDSIASVWQPLREALAALDTEGSDGT